MKDYVAAIEAVAGSGSSGSSGSGSTGAVTDRHTHKETITTVSIKEIDFDNDNLLSSSDDSDDVDE